MALATRMQTNMQIGAAQQLPRSSMRSPFTAAPSQLARSRTAFVVRAEDTRDRGAKKLDSDSYQSAPLYWLFVASVDWTHLQPSHMIVNLH